MVAKCFRSAGFPEFKTHTVIGSCLGCVIKLAVGDNHIGTKNGGSSSYNTGCVTL